MSEFKSEKKIFNNFSKSIIINLLFLIVNTKLCARFYYSRNYLIKLN